MKNKWLLVPVWFTILFIYNIYARWSHSSDHSMLFVIVEGLQQITSPAQLLLSALVVMGIRKLNPKPPATVNMDAGKEAVENAGIKKKKLMIGGIVAVCGLVILLVAFFVDHPKERRPDFSRSQDARLADAYFVRSFKNHAFIVEHGGIRFTATCTKSVSWGDGDNAEPRMMADHDCIYMYGLIGKSVGHDLMYQLNGTLAYYPWAGAPTVQTADFLEIISEEPIK